MKKEKITLEDLNQRMKALDNSMKEFMKEFVERYNANLASSPPNELGAIVCLDCQRAIIPGSKFDSFTTTTNPPSVIYRCNNCRRRGDTQ